SLRIFRAGLKHSLVDAKWPAFEEVFFGFDPQKVVLMSAEHLERLMQDARLIRHLGKLKSVPRNAQMVLDLAREHGSFGNYLSLISLRIFRAGLKHSLVDAKWPAFEEVFFGFDPQKVVLMSAEHLERLMQDARLIRHLGKLKSVPRNAQMVLDLAREH
ncbi:DNA-3-methyladenine glycosylase I, partial [Pseudomonas aeruginosa]|uniref:DNA-3-methyladenine glycosylase I n=1 Tax=Pseudomonas aeruginosa TaxID=287 RepID=UPI000B2472FE